VCTRLILTVEYTRSALTAMLYFEEDGVLDIIRAEHHTELGAAALDECQASNDTTRCLKPPKSSFGRLVRMPIDEIRWLSDTEVPLGVSDVILLGDEGRDSRVKRALHDMLNEEIVLLPKTIAQSQGQGYREPKLCVRTWSCFCFMGKTE
jgi:hypothetical protein